MMALDCGPCVVRPWRPADKGSLLAMANNRKVWINLSHRFPHPYTEQDADYWLGLVANQAEGMHWAIEVDGRAVGAVGADRGEGIFARSARFGYWLGEPFWGRGIMTAAVRGTSDYLLTETDLVRLEAPVFEWNPPSMRVLEKCGFQREGTMRKSITKDGWVIDAVLYSRLRA